MSLDDCRMGTETDIPWISTKDVKQFIKKLKDWSLYFLCHNDIRPFLEQIEKLAGKGLI